MHFEYVAKSGRLNYKHQLQWLGSGLIWGTVSIRLELSQAIHRQNIN